jgi:hypothetical protein
VSNLNQSILLEYSSYIASICKLTKGLPGDATRHLETKPDIASKKDNGKLGFILSRDLLRVTEHT